jgi:hypothetical protein
MDDIMRRFALLLVAVAMAAGVVAFTAPASGHADEETSPIYGVKIPAEYRDWKLIAVDNLLIAGKVDQLRAQLGNDIAIKTFKEGKVPFPDGTIIAAIHRTRVPGDKALHETCFACHTPAKDRDYVFTRYAP